MRKTATLLMLVLLLIAACRRREQSATSTRGSAQPPAKKAAPAAPAGTEVGSMMPEYSATFLDGSKFELATKRDRVVLLNLWATWCGPCRAEIPELQVLHAKYGPKGFEVIGVSVDEGGADGVKQFVDELKMTYPVALDPEAKLASLFQTSWLPTSVLVDRTGKIVWKRFGIITPDDAELTAAIEKAL
ncbi:MAG TPA: TlpA disulfide reductase family protein [Thermoanaerobaculia bacterium]|nr:TlpA disulfide reductase family protein [Thermoanaerobaculia bacterium]